MNKTAHEYWQGITESQLPDPDIENMEGLRLCLTFDLFELITDEQIRTLAERVNFARRIKNNKPIF